MKRETGYYWVLFDHKWRIAEWDGKWWSITAIDWLEDTDFEEIEEHRVERI